MVSSWFFESASRTAQRIFALAIAFDTIRFLRNILKCHGANRNGIACKLTHRLKSARTSTKGANRKFHSLQAKASATNETFCWLLWALFFCYFSLEKQRKVMKNIKISSFLLSWNKRNKNSRLLKISLKSAYHQSDCSNRYANSPNNLRSVQRIW